METKVNEILREIKLISDPEIKIKKENRFGIRNSNSWGAYQKDLKQISNQIGKSTSLGILLFDTEIYEARLLCANICNPKEITEQLMEKWVKEFTTWEICDSFCMKLFKFNDQALNKAFEWSRRDSEFEKRAGLVLMATYGFADKEAPNNVFESFFPVLEANAYDNRIYVKKAVSWAIRQIGKRNNDLRILAIQSAKRIKLQQSTSAKWIATDALRELTNEKLNMLDYPRRIYRVKTN